MTTANKLTLFRIVLIPLMIVLIYIEPLSNESGFLKMPWHQLIFAILFVIAACTDFLDGYIARKYQQITTFGKFLDPIADKILVLTAALYLMVLMPTRIMFWAVLIIIIREFVVTGIRLLAVEKGFVIAASPFGKIKTFLTMIALIVLLFNDFGLPIWIGDVLFYSAVLMTLFSGIDYAIKNRKIILESI